MGGSPDHKHDMGWDPGGTTESNGGGNGRCSGGGEMMDFHTHSVAEHDHAMDTMSNEPPYVTLGYIVYSP